jgi:hypothetical protein
MQAPSLKELDAALERFEIKAKAEMIGFKNKEDTEKLTQSVNLRLYIVQV